MFYFTRKTQEFHVDYMTFKRSQYEYHLLPYKCLVCFGGAECNTDHYLVVKEKVWKETSSTEV